MSHESLNKLIESFEIEIWKQFSHFPKSSKIEINFGHNKTTNVVVRIFSKKMDFSGKIVFKFHGKGEYTILKSLDTSKKKVKQMAPAE